MARPSAFGRTIRGRDAELAALGDLLDRVGLGRVHAAPEQRYWRLQDLQSRLERAAMSHPLVISLERVLEMARSCHV